VKPLARDIQIRWPDKEIHPKKDRPDSEPWESLFAVLVSNIGNSNAISVQLTFTLDLNRQAFQATLESSEMIQGLRVDGATIRSTTIRPLAFSSSRLPARTKSEVVVSMAAHPASVRGSTIQQGPSSNVNPASEVPSG
jgi:hypothetical protein